MRKFLFVLASTVALITPAVAQYVVTRLFLLVHGS